MSNVTQILQKFEGGDSSAAEQLLIERKRIPSASKRRYVMDLGVSPESSEESSGILLEPVS